MSGWLPAAQRQGWVLVVFLLLGLTAGAVVFVTTPSRWVASAHVRVGTIDGDRPVVDPLTAAVEASEPSFLRRVRARAGVEGSLEANGVFHTHLLAVRAYGGEPGAAVALLDAATGIIVAEQNALIEQMQRDAGQRLGGSSESVAVVPTLSRPAVRIGDQVLGKKTSPFLAPLLAAGAGLGLFVGLIVAWWRESAR